MALEHAAPGRKAPSRLSVAALRSAEALRSDEVEVIADHLYSYNSIPISPEWQSRLANRSGIEQALGLSSHSELRSTLEVNWLQLPSSAVSGWLTWLGRGSGLELGGGGPEFKLYVSPAVESLENVFPELVRALTSSRARSFKAGADSVGLLRPDKLVAYFSDIGDLASVAYELERRLAGVVAQGVPFTAEISSDGLLSWGVDPPTRSSARGRRAPSWREWICIRLAMALVEARQEEDGTEPLWPLAVKRLEDDGIQVDRWLPSPQLWRYPP